jgi:bifunctional enzyme CysN/CysC
VARAAAGDRFHEIYVRAALATCEARDPRGLYRAARAGDIAQFTGVSAAYEPPGNPDLMLDTDRLSVDEAVEQLVAYIGTATTVELARSGYPSGSFAQSSLRNV